MLGNSLFGSNQLVPRDANIVYVSDMYVQDTTGGAELTGQALLDSSPFKVHTVYAKQLTMAHLEQGMNAFWVFGNFSQMNPQLIPSIIANLKYGIVEYDYKYCEFRSPEKHLTVKGTPCDCHNKTIGKMVSAFFYAAEHVWWMSERQKERYTTMFPFLLDRESTVLSSVFSAGTLSTIRSLRSTANPQRSGWLILDSSSWIKGTDDARQWCQSNGKQYSTIKDMRYIDVLSALSKAEGLVYLPKGGDTCPRLVIEAKLLGCQLVINENVQHKDEEWFATSDVTQIESYLMTATSTFWNTIALCINHVPSISGYTTTLNCLKQQYPFKECISSMLGFCDEVIVVDGGSTDGTWEALQRMSNDDARLKVHQVKRDWSTKRSSLFDGMQKAEARALCTSEFCWQMDSDEIVHENDYEKIKHMCKSLQKGINVVSLPVIEYWSSTEKVRLDVTPWKWRLSRNVPRFTHGVPARLRAYDADGMYALPGTDGCDMIDRETGEPLEHVTFYTQDVDKLRLAALAGDDNSRKQYERWFNDVVNSIPAVHHYSWFDLTRKIKLYRDYWQTHWAKLWGQDISDTSSNNMMFDCPWAEVSDDMIADLAKRLSNTGGWIWHKKWDGSTTPWLTVTKSEPGIMTRGRQ